MNKKVILSLFCVCALASVGLANDVSCGNQGQPEPKDPCLGSVGANPINPLMGNLHREVTDLQTFGFAPVSFTRIYNSRTTNFNSSYWDFGYKQTWQHNWNYEVRDLSSKTHGIKNVKVRYPNGSEYNFEAVDATGSVRVPAAELGDRLYPWAGSPVGFTLTTPDGRELDFERAGSPKYRLVRARDGKGVTLTFSYDADGRLQRIANPFGRWIEIERGDVEGKLCITKVRSHDGREVSYDYEAWTPTNSVTLSGVQYPGGETANYTYVGASTPATGRPLLASASDPMYGGAGARVRYVYNYGMTFDFGGGPYLVTGVAKEERNLVTDSLIVSLPLGTGADVPVIEGSGAEIRRRFVNGLVAEQVDGEGNVTAFDRESDGYGYIASRTDPQGAVTSYVRDFAGRITSKTDPIGGVHQKTYNASGLVLSETDTLGRSTYTTRNSLNQPIQIDYPDGSFEEWTYNSFGRPLTHRRADGGIATYSYYALGELGGFPQDLKTETDSLGHSVHYTYTNSGLLETTSDRRGFITSFTYDWRGQMLDAHYADGAVASQAWDDWGNKVAAIDELGNATLFSYTEYNQLASVTDPFGRVRSFEYGLQPDCGGCSYKQTLALEIHPSGRRTTHSYDFRGKRISTTMAADTDIAATSSFAYDSAGNLVTTVDPLGRSTSSVYDLDGRLISQTNALGETASWIYDSEGNLLSETRPNGATTTFQYDARDRAYRITETAGGVTERVFDASGRVTQVIDPLGRAISTVYDLEGRATQLINADGTFRTLEYDESGNLTRTTDEHGEQTVYVYDARGRRVSQTDPLAHTWSTLYDAASRMIAEISPAGRRTDYSYDQTDQRIAVTVGAGTPDAASMDFTYDFDGNLVSQTDAEGSVDCLCMTRWGERSSPPTRSCGRRCTTMIWPVT